jgi:hypothetical protein
VYAEEALFTNVYVMVGKRVAMTRLHVSRDKFGFVFNLTGQK